MTTQRFFILLAIGAVCCTNSPAQLGRPSDAGAPKLSFVRESVLTDRAFPLFTALINDDAIRSILASDSGLHAFTAQKWASVSSANKDCGADVSCKSKRLRFEPSEIAAVSAALTRLYASNAVLRSRLHNVLSERELTSGEVNESIRFVDSWTHGANAINQIISIYCDGQPAKYGEIDAMPYHPDSKSYGGLITILIDDLAIQESPAPSRNIGDTLFFEPSLRFGIRLLQSNSRDEAGRLWPLKTGENRAALARLRTLDWRSYQYSSILVPGAGSEIPNVAISPWGRERVRLSVAAFRSGKAPYIMVSGGFVHPSQTPYCEALQMKKYLMEVYGLPENVILLEPYARHTTTNLRNASREAFEYGLPAAKQMLIVSDDAQLTYIQSETFAKRNLDELGYAPMTLGKRVSPFELEAQPSISSLYVDARDPLDP